MANLTSQALLDAVVARYELTIPGPLQAPIIALLDRAIENGSDLGATLLRIPQVRNPLTEEFGGEDGQLDGPGLISAINELQGIVDEVEEASAAISLTADVEAVDEGDAVNFTIEAAEGEDALAEGTEVAYTLSGVDADDIDGDLTGTAVIGADGTATVTVNLVEDQVTEGEETLTMSIDVDGTAVSTNVTVNDTSAAITFALSAAQTAINEGASNTFTVTASQPVAEDTTVTFELKIDGETTSLADFNAGAFNPVTVTIPAGETEATFDVESITADGTEASETYRVEAVVNGETLSQQVTLLDGTEGAGQTFQLTSGLDIIPGLKGSNGNTVTSGNDTIVGTIDTTNGTLNATDQIDAGDGTDTLKVIGGTDITNANIPNYSNVEILSLSSAGTATITQDTTAQAGLEQVKVTAAAGAIDLDAATTQDVSVAGAKAAVAVDGGKNVVVNDSFAGNNITIGDTTESAGSVSVTDTKQGTGTITVEGGTDVTVAATVAATTADVAGGTINVGNNTDQPTGAISVTQTNTSSGATTPAVKEQQTLTFTADDVADGNEELTIDIDANSGGLLDGPFTVDLSAVDTTNVSAVATKVASDIDAITGVSASAAGGVVTITYDSTNFNAADTMATVSADTSGGLGVAVDPAARAPSAVANVDLTAGAINVQGGTTIDVDVNSTSTAATSTANGDIINGTVTATAGDNTTSISIDQDLTANTNTKAATDLVGGTSTVTFKALASGASVTVAGLTFTAAKNLTAEEVAQAFADLTAVDTQSNGTVAQGTYTQDVDASIISGSASGSSVVFTNTAGAAAPTLGLASSAGATSLPTAVTATGTAAVAAVTSTNTVTAGAVTANDNATASVTDLTLSSFGTATLGAANGFDALVNLSLTDSNGATTLDTAATSLTMNVNDVVDNVSIDSGAATVTDLTINTSGTKSDFDLTAAAVTDLTVAGDTNLILAGSTLSALETVSISGAGAVSLGDISATVTAVNASTATGGISATVDGTKAVVTTGTGNDSITVDTAGISKAINLGEGDDTLTLSAATANVPTAAVAGGAGTDTIAMTIASAQALGNNSSFANAIAGFERLTLTDPAGSNNTTQETVAIDVEALGFDYVTSNGTVLDTGSGTAANSDILQLDNMANNGTLAIVAAAAGANTAHVVNVKDADTNAADVLNLIVEGDASINAGTVTANDVETLNIAANDVFVDSSNPQDGKDNNDATHVLTANGDSVESIVVTGDDLNLTTNSMVLTSVDASAMTGGLIYTANGASAGTTVQGGMGADTLTASGSNDVLNGGAGNDTLKGANLTQLTGGEGADTFVMNTPSNVNSYSTITDLEAGDVIDLDTSDGGLVAFTSAAVQLAGTAVFQDYANEAVNNLGTDANDAAWFQFGGNTYIVQSGDATANNDFQNGVDSIIQIEGEVDLSLASYNQTIGTLEIA